MCQIGRDRVLTHKGAIPWYTSRMRRAGLVMATRVCHGPEVMRQGQGQAGMFSQQAKAATGKVRGLNAAPKKSERDL